MSQMVTRQRTGGDEKEKRTDSPVKDMKKKMAANAEKEKNAAESTPSKSEKPVEKLASKPAEKPLSPTDKPTGKPLDKPTDKPTGKPLDKPTDKPTGKPSDKPTEKPADKAEKSKTDKPADKQKEKAPEKPAEKKVAEKKDAPSEKKKEENGKGESSGKTEKAGKAAKQNGSSNGMNGTAHASSDSELLEEGDETELFPELAYDDSDVEWEPGMDSTRSLTRRSQVKATRTPETPRPASDKTEGEESKESKVLKLSQETAKDSPKSDKKSDAKSDKKSDATSDKKSDAKSDAKKPDAKQDGGQETAKADAKKEVKESPKKDDKKVKESPKKDDKKDEKSEKVEFEIVVEIESSGDASEESRKPDTNFSKSRVKVSPYRRSMRLADQTTSSVAANYTGNNTTMEMDITEGSSFMEDTLDDSYLSGLRSIRGRRSYKPLTDMPRSAAVNRSVRSVTSSIIVSEQSSRPTAPVVGRKRKPEPEDNVSIASEAEELPVAGKRQRLLERLARPFRRTTLLPIRRNAEIVGINTDLPLTAPVASTSSFDPETLKPAPADPAAPVTPLVAATPAADDAKRCVIM